MNKFQNIIDKFHLENYLSSKLILAIDLIISLFASLCSLLFIKMLLFKSIVTVDFMLVWLAASLVMSFIMFYWLKTYRSIIRHSTLREFARLCMASVGKVILMGVLVMLLPYGIKSYIFFLMVLDLILTIVFLLLVRIAMIVVYDILRNKVKKSNQRLNVMVYGTDDKAVAVVKRLQNSPHYSTIGYLEYGQRLKGQRIDGLKIFYFETAKDIELFSGNFALDAILFPRESEVKNEEQRLLEYCQDNNVKVLLSPTIDEVHEGRIINSSVRELKVEDILGREDFVFSSESIEAKFKGKTVLVTGAAGSMGSELCRLLAKFKIGQLILLDSAETAMHNLHIEFEDKFPNLDFKTVIGDVRHIERLDYIFRQYHPHFVFHAAAYKNVPMMEENPCEAVLANVVGARNVADMSVQYGVSQMVLVSTDKAVNPTNVMGCTKRLAEIYVHALGHMVEHGDVEAQTKFLIARYGNDISSAGSVIPIFRDQIAKGGPVKVVHKDAMRFFRTISDSAKLILEATSISTGNEVFVFDTGKSVKIDTLARKMITMAGLEPDKDIHIEYTGLRPGEKLYEEVLSNTEGTIPTSHSCIRVAKVREYKFAEAKQLVNQLDELAKAVSIPDMIKLMKKSVPEYISRNSKYELYDLRK